MTYPLPEFPSLFPSGEWWRLYVESGSIKNANSGCGCKAREWMRFRVAEDTMLSIPTDGGASALKNHNPETWTLAARFESDRRKILATIATLYGRYPYFDTVMDRLTQCFTSVSNGARASAICTAAFTAVVDFLNIDILVPEFSALVKNGDGRFGQICREANAKADLSLSILDTLMRLGPDAIFTLIPSF